MFTLIKNGQIYTPTATNVTTLFLVGDKIGRLGDIDEKALASLGCDYQIIDASDCLVIPGLIDPHQHFIGGGGESGFASRLPPIELENIVKAGITTAVGCLGTDTVSRTLADLLAQARQFSEQGLTTYIYTGGFHVPPQTFTGRIAGDFIVVDKVIGIGELALSDVRSLNPAPSELTRLVSEAVVGGSLTGKAGVTHFHMGEGKERLAPLRELLDQYEIEPASLYPTHIGRNKELFDEAIELARRGVFVDMDTVDENIVKWLGYYRKHKAPLPQLTFSSDSQTAGGSPAKFYNQFVAAAQEFGLAEVLPHFTLNTANVLKLSQKGRLEAQADADVVVLKKESLELVHVFAKGRHLLKNGRLHLSN